VSQGLYHRDIKPENIMLNDKNDIVLVDFGLSNHFHNDDDLLRGTQGTTLYFAPEIVRTGVKDKKVYGRQVDMWACGISLY
jgi:serine/threonine protein kinase